MDYIKFEDEIILSKQHPFVANFYVLVGDDNNGWVVKWRDFTTTSQDRFFDKKEEAEAFASALRAGCRILNSYYTSFFDECDGHHY
jgi:hypothetical protein